MGIDTEQCHENVLSKKPAKFMSETVKSRLDDTICSLDPCLRRNDAFLSHLRRQVSSQNDWGLYNHDFTLGIYNQGRYDVPEFLNNRPLNFHPKHNLHRQQLLYPILS